MMRSALLPSLILAIVLCPLTVSAQMVDRGYELAPKAIRAAVEKAERYMVRIDTVGGINLGAGGRRAQQRIGGLSNPGQGPTTGLVLTDDGYIITSTFNFIRKPRVITVTLPNGKQYVAELMGRDETRKLCLLKIDDVEGLEVPNFVDPAKLAIGQWAISVGTGYGSDDPAVSVGIVSALQRVAGRAVQTDANLSPANYGGPLLDIRGDIIGICTPLNPKARGAGAGSEWYDSGIGFAVTLDGIDHLIERMKDKDTVLKRGLVGIAPALQPDEDGGVIIERVLPGSPAAKAELVVGEVVTAIDDMPTPDFAAMARALALRAAGDEIALTVRDKERAERQVELKLTDKLPRARPNRPSRNQPQDDDGEEGDEPDAGEGDEGDEPAAEAEDEEAPEAEAEGPADGEDAAGEPNEAGEAEPEEADADDAEPADRIDVEAHGSGDQPPQFKIQIIEHGG